MTSHSGKLHSCLRVHIVKAITHLNIVNRCTANPFMNDWMFLRTNRYCYGCLRIGHVRKDCRNKANCITCKGRHPSVLHVDGRIAPRTEVTPTNNAIVHASTYAQKEGNVTGAGDVTLAVIPVKVHVRGSLKMVETYAFLDPGSNGVFLLYTSNESTKL